MKQCPKCGYPVADKAKFCPVCGAQAPKSGKAGKALAIAAVAAAAAALVLLGVRFLPELLRSPAEEFVSYQQEALAAPLLSVIGRGLDGYSAVEEVSTDITVTLSTDSAEINQFLTDTSLVLKLDMDREELVFNGDVTLMGSPLFSGTLTYQKGRLGVCLPELDENYYVMDLSGLLSELSGEEIEVGEAKLPEISSQEWTALIQTYLELVSAAVNEDNVALEKRVDFRLEDLGYDYTGNVYTYTPTAADVESMLCKLADRLESDQDLRGLVLKLVDEETLLEAMDSRCNSLDDALTDAAAKLREGAAQAGKSVEESGFTWKLYMEGKTVRMVRWEMAGRNAAMVYECSGGTEESKQTLYGIIDGEKAWSCRHDFARTGDTSQGRAALDADGSSFTWTYKQTGSDSRGTIHIVVDGESVALDYHMDTEKRSASGVPYGGCILTMPDEGITMSMDVTEGASGSTDYTVTVQSDVLDPDTGLTQVILHINATAESTATAPTQTPVDITNWTGDQLDALVEKIGNQAVGRFYGVLFPLLYGM